MIEIKPFTQTDESRCGPACIKMVLSYYGIEATEDEICERCNWTYELGCTDLQMKAAIESYGLECIIYNDSNFEQIQLWLGLKVPVIVDWFSPGVDLKLSDMPNGHSSVVVDLDDTHIHLMDPELGGIRTILRDEFMRVWLDWRHDPYLQSCDDLILRQIMIALPTKFKHL